MHYFIFYNESGDVIGWLETEGGCSSKNAREVSKEEFVENGGVTGTTAVTSPKPDILLNSLLDAIIQ